MVGNLNIRAGIAYLYIRGIAKTDSEDEIIDSTIQTYTIKPGDTVAALISKGILKTTQKNIIQNTAGLTKESIGRLKPGQTINFQIAKPVRKVSEWKDWMEAIRIYNIGDPDYMKKVQRSYQIITSRTK